MFKNLHFPIIFLGFELNLIFQSPFPESWINLKDFDQKTEGRRENICEAEVLNFVNYVSPS